MVEVIIWFLNGIPTVLENLEKRCYLQMPSSRLGKGVVEKLSKKLISALQLALISINATHPYEQN